MEILFVHGAGGWMDDQPLAAELRNRLNVPVVMPEFPEEDMSAAQWRRELERWLTSMEPGAVVVGHSFGASMALLHYADESGAEEGGANDGVADNDRAPAPLGLVLLATPAWGTEGWQAEYALPPAAQLRLPVRLHHCRDDDVVPFAHLERLAERIPHAAVRRHATGGHQFEGRMGAIAEDVAALGNL